MPRQGISLEQVPLRFPLCLDGPPRRAVLARREASRHDQMGGGWKITGTHRVRVAILHPWFLMRGGGEKVVDVLAGIYPQADIFTLFVNPEKLSSTLRSRGVHPSILNAFPLSSRLHRHLMPLYPWAIESLDLSAYDLVISSCGPAMMGCNTRQDTVHVCYCHTPQRSWWDLYSEHQSQLPTLLRHMF